MTKQNSRKNNTKRTKTIRTKTKKTKTKIKNNKTVKIVTTTANSLDKSIKKNFNVIKLKCSPKTQQKDYTCLEDDTLYKLKELWNARHPESTIKTNDSKEIWEILNVKMNNVCNKESCWLKQKFVDGKLDKELTNSFAPVSPKEWKKNPNEWLSSTDILDVMKQYERAYKCFDFIGPSPIDFDTKKIYGECVWEELCHFNLEDEIKNGKFKIGVIFNTDPHNKPGSHWISLFINIKKGTIFFFDSAGDKIPKKIMALVTRVIKQGKNLDDPINFNFDQNYPIEHQYSDTECGIYSLYFIAHMLEDKINAHYLKTHILKDKYMEKFRKVYFNASL